MGSKKKRRTFLHGRNHVCIRAKESGRSVERAFVVQGKRVETEVMLSRYYPPPPPPYPSSPDSLGWFLGGGAVLFLLLALLLGFEVKSSLATSNKLLQESALSLFYGCNRNIFFRLSWPFLWIEERNRTAARDTVCPIWTARRLGTWRVPFLPR